MKVKARAFIFIALLPKPSYRTQRTSHVSITSTSTIPITMYRILSGLLTKRTQHTLSVTDGLDAAIQSKDPRIPPRDSQNKMSLICVLPGSQGALLLRWRIDTALPTGRFIKHFVTGLGSTLFLLSPLTGQARPVIATVYDSYYAGRTTYCGQRYDHWGYSAAHPWLPCGTRVRVTHRGRSLTVPVTDRCDCSLDLSAGAAYRLGVPLDGIATVYISY